MQGEPEQSQVHPEEQVPKGLGWLLKPATAGEIGVYISGVQGAKEFTPEMLRSLEELMQQLQQENQDVVSARRKCGKLDACTGNHQGCPVLTSCTRNFVDCDALSFCTGNN